MRYDALLFIALVGLAPIADAWRKGEKRAAIACAAAMVVILGAVAGILHWAFGALAFAGIIVLAISVQYNEWKRGKVRETLREVAVDAVFCGGISGYFCWLLYDALGQENAGMSPDVKYWATTAMYVCGALAVVSAVLLIALGAAVLVIGPDLRRGNN